MREWNEPRKDEAKASAPETPPHRSRKDRRRWCKGREGVVHQPEIRLRRDVRHRLSAGLGQGQARCRWALWFYRGERTKPRVTFWCAHERACVECERIMETFLPWHECPNLHECPDRKRLGELACERCGYALDDHGHGEELGLRCPVDTDAGKRQRYSWGGDPILVELTRSRDDE